MTGTPRDDLTRELGSLRESHELFVEEQRKAPGCPDENDFLRYLAGKGRRAQKRRIRDHLLVCPACLAMAGEVLGASPVPEAVPSLSAPAPRRKWAWGFGFGIPAAALCSVFLLIVLSGPTVEMQFRITRSSLRSGSPDIVMDRGVLHRGDEFRLEISARKPGYFFLYAWSDDQGGDFLFPTKESAGNFIEKGEVLLIPEEDSWKITGTRIGVEVLFLLFSDKPVDQTRFIRIEQEVREAGTNSEKMENVLRRHFALEQKFVYTIQ